MGSRSKGGYKDADTRRAAQEVKREQEFPLPPKKQTVADQRAAVVARDRRKRKRWRRKRKR